MTREVISQQCIVWLQADIAWTSKPLVYIFWADETHTVALYIGKSSRGIKRPLHEHHPQASIRDTAHSIEFRICASNEEAEALEKQLIRSLEPTFNIACKPRMETVNADAEAEVEATRNSVSFTCSLDAETLQLLRDMALRLDLSMSQLLRRLIREAAKKSK